MVDYLFLKKMLCSIEMKTDDILAASVPCRVSSIHMMLHQRAFRWDMTCHEGYVHHHDATPGEYSEDCDFIDAHD